MSRVPTKNTQATKTSLQSAELASQDRKNSGNKDSSLKRLTSLNSLETSSEHSSEDARPTINFGSLDNFDEALQEQAEGKQGVSGMDFSFCAADAPPPAV